MPAYAPYAKVTDMNREILNNAVTQLSFIWKLSNVRPLAELRLVNNYIVVAYSAVYRTDVVLKILLWEDAQKCEARALHYFNGSGCIKLLAHNEHYHALLLPYITPGETLRSLFPNDDESATHILVEVSKKLHAHPVSDVDFALFPDVAQWLTALDKEYADIPKHLLEDARLRAKNLLKRNSTMYVLHGDLHHDNILHDGNSWIAIDPKGVIGEREYEFGAFIRNPFPDLITQPDARRIISKRIELCSKLSGFDMQRIADWAFVQAVMSACWTHEESKENLMNYFVSCATVMQ